MILKLTGGDKIEDFVIPPENSTVPTTVERTKVELVISRIKGSKTRSDSLL